MPAMIIAMLGGRIRLLAAHGISVDCEPHLQGTFVELITPQDNGLCVQARIGQIDGNRSLVLGATLIRCLALAPIYSLLGQPVAMLIVMDDRPWAITGGLMGLLGELAQQAAPDVEVAITALGFHVDKGPRRQLNEQPVRFQHERIALLAGEDERTGLPGPVLFRDRLSEALKRAQRSQQKAALVLVDLRGLDVVRREQGEQAGDILLHEFVRRLRESRRQTDTVARLRDDEFALIFEQLECAADAKTASLRLLKSLCWPFQYEDRVLDAVAELGLAVFPDDAQDMESLLRRAGEDLEQCRHREGQEACTW